MFVEEEDRTAEVDESGEFCGFLAGAVVDVEFHFPHGDAGDGGDEGRISDAEDDAAEFPPAFDEFDVFDFAVGEVDAGHAVVAIVAEDVSLEPPVEFDVFGQEAEFAVDFVAAERVGGGEEKPEADGVGIDHGLADEFPAVGGNRKEWMWSKKRRGPVWGRAWGDVLRLLTQLRAEWQGLLGDPGERGVRRRLQGVCGAGHLRHADHLRHVVEAS